MASTYSPSLRLELMATGDQSGTWGDTTNTNLGTLLEQSITGYLSKAMADANQTLTNLNGASDEARNMIVEATGALTAGRNMVVPTAEKLYLIKNSTTGGFAVTVKTTAGTGVAVPMNGSRWVYCDGTNVVDGQSGPLTPTTSDSAALGTAALMWSDLFLASGGVINWNNGVLTLTQATETLTQAFIDAGATAGPVYDLYRDSASPAAADILGRLIFNGRDSAANKQEYAAIEAVISSPTTTAEVGALDFYATVAGTRARIMSAGPNNPNTPTQFIDGYATTATAAGTTTLTVASAKNQYFTGTTTQTVVLPVTSTLVLGQQFRIVNNSTGLVTVQSSGANTIQVMGGTGITFAPGAPGTELVLTCIAITGTGTASWAFKYESPNTAWTAYTPTFTNFGTATAIFAESRRVGPTLQIRAKFTTGTTVNAQARMSLGFNGGNSNVTASLANVPSLQVSGVGVLSIAAATAVYTLCEGSTSYITFSFQSGSTAGTAQLAAVNFGDGTTVSIMADIPIEGW